MLFSWHCRVMEPSGEQLQAAVVAERHHTVAASPALGTKTLSPVPLPRQPLAEKPKKPCWHRSHFLPVTPGWQEHCPDSTWHPLSRDPVGWHSQLAREVEGHEQAESRAGNMEPLLAPWQPQAMPHIPLAPHGGLQAIVARLALPTGSACHVWEAVALACARITALQPRV